MEIKFVRGPYDGMEIDHTVVNKYGHNWAIVGDVGERKFVELPPRASWDRILSGEKADERPVQTYEYFFGPGGVRGEWAPPGAVERAKLEAQLKIDPRAQTALANLYDEDRQAVIAATAGLQQSDPASWPADLVDRLSPDERVYLLKLPSKLRAFVRVLDSGQLELLDIARENTLRLFLEHYRGAGKVG